MNGLLILVGGGEFEPEMKYVDRILLDKVMVPLASPFCRLQPVATRSLR